MSLCRLSSALHLRFRFKPESPALTRLEFSPSPAPPLLPASTNNHPVPHHRTVLRGHESDEMKIFSTSHDFNYSWEEVSIANWRKYSPWNKKTPHVIAVDTLARHVDPETGIVSFSPFPGHKIAINIQHEHR